MVDKLFYVRDDSESFDIRIASRLRFFVFLTGLMSCVATASATDLIEGFEAARAHDSILASAQAAYRAGIEVLPQAKANLGPNVQAGALASAVRAQLQGFPATRGSALDADLTATQPLFHPASQIALEQARAKLPGLDAQLKAAEQDLILRFAQAYLGALLAMDTLDYTVKFKESIAAQLKQAQRAYDIGTGTVTDVADAKARFDLATATELQNQGSLEAARRGLEVLTGVPTGALAALNIGVQPMSLLGKDFQSWIATADVQNLQVLQSQSAAQAQRLQIDAAKAAWLPTLDLVGTLSQQRYSQTDLSLSGNATGRAVQIGIQFTIPIWEPGARDSQLRQAIAQSDQADNDLLTSRRTASLNARQALINLATYSSQVAAYEQAVQSSQVSLNASTRGNQIGSRTAVDVLNARQQYFQAQSQLAAARYATALALLQLKAAVGTLSEADLRALNGHP